MTPRVGYTEMKDSGIEWIGEIPEDWTIMRIKTCYKIIGGNGFSPELQGDTVGDYPVCKASDISAARKYLISAANYISKEVVANRHFNIIPAGSVILPKIGEAMKKNSRALCAVDCCADNNCQGLVPVGIDQNFSYYLLVVMDMRWFDNAGTMPCVNNQKLKDSRIPYPPLFKQSAIADYLDAQCAKIDEVIAGAKASIEEYKRWKASVIYEAVTKGLDPNAEMKDSGIEWIGEIPKTWAVTKAKTVLRHTSIKNCPHALVLSLYRDLGVVPKDSRNDNHNVTSEDTTNYKYVCPGNLVINKMKAWQGSLAVSNYEGIVSPAYYVCEFRNRRISKEYIHYLLRCKMYSQEFERLSTGMRVGQWDLGIDDFMRVPIVIPTDAEQSAIADYLDAQCAKIDELIAEKQALIADLEAYKKSLIYEVVTGKRKVC